MADVIPDAIAGDYAMSTVRLRDAYLERYSHHGAERVLEEVRCPEEGVYNMLEYLQQAGGVRAYLEGIGLADGDIGRLRAKLR